MSFDIERWRQTHVLHPQTTFRCAAGEGAGDCIRACIATLLQIHPSVLPNWMGSLDDEWADALDADLRDLGYAYGVVTFEEAQRLDPPLDPQGPVLLGGVTAKGQPHCTVGLLDGTLLHDPLGNGGCPVIEQVWIVVRAEDLHDVDKDDVSIAPDALRHLP